MDRADPDKQKLTFEQLGVRIRGLTLGELLSGEFIQQIKKEMPEAVFIHVAMGLKSEGDLKILSLNHEVSRNKGINMDYLDVEGDDTMLVNRLVDIIKKTVE